MDSIEEGRGGQKSGVRSSSCLQVTTLTLVPGAAPSTHPSLTRHPAPPAHNLPEPPPSSSPRRPACVPTAWACPALSLEELMQFLEEGFTAWRGTGLSGVCPLVQCCSPGASTQQGIREHCEGTEGHPQHHSTSLTATRSHSVSFPPALPRVTLQVALQP